MQPVAITGNSPGGGNRGNKRNPLPCVASGCKSGAFTVSRVLARPRAFERSGALQSYSKRRILPLKHRLLGTAAEGRPYEEETIGGVPRIRVGAVGAGARLGARTAPNNESATYEWHLEVPNVAMAPNGDTVAVTGNGDVRRTSEVRLGRRQLHAHVRGRRQPNRHVYGGWAGRLPAVRPRRRVRQPAPARSLRRPVGAAGQPGAGREPVVVVGRSTA